MTEFDRLVREGLLADADGEWYDEDDEDDDYDYSHIDIETLVNMYGPPVPDPERPVEDTPKDTGD